MTHDTHKTPLTQLVVSPQGFVFDPGSGHGYTANDVARFIIALLKDNVAKEQIAQKLHQHFNVSPDEAENDLDDFYHQLHLLALI